MALLPNRVDYVMTGGGVGDGDHGRLAVAGRPGSTWELVVSVLEELLGQPQAKGRQLRILLSDAWIGYRVLPWDPSVAGRSQWERYARAYFQEAQNDADEWIVAMEQPWPQCNVMACRMPKGLATAINEMARQHRGNIDSIQPLFVGSLNRYRPPTLTRDFWWLASDGCRMVCGLWRSGAGETGFRGWQTVRNQAIGERFDPQELIRREELQIGVANDSLPIVVCCRDSGQWEVSDRIILAGADAPPEIFMPLAA